MPLESVRATAERIRRLEIQGARNVAIAAIRAMEALAEEAKGASREELLRILSEAKEILFAARETEPLMRNAIRWIISEAHDRGGTDAMALAEAISSASKSFLKSLEGWKDSIAEIGARRIRDGSVVFTHCHSSTVIEILRRAKADGKRFEVICTETRPLFQGRMTAWEMLKAGIKTTLIVDSAARSFINDADLAIVGADAITSEGNVVNKIGTSAIALMAQEARTPFYVASELLKYDPATAYGDYEAIEERGPAEVWDGAPEGLIIRNPAFDVTRRDFIHGIICEEGIISPHSVTEVVRRRYPWVFARPSP
ncbi:MAG: S-methyl-5-thioribose-1-phosphate isomerase [Candidatus Bathyarchaeia archaeon]